MIDPFGLKNKTKQNKTKNPLHFSGWHFASHIFLRHHSNVSFLVSPRQMFCSFCFHSTLTLTYYWAVFIIILCQASILDYEFSELWHYNFFQFKCTAPKNSAWILTQTQGELVQWVNGWMDGWMNVFSLVPTVYLYLFCCVSSPRIRKAVKHPIHCGIILC